MRKPLFHTVFVLVAAMALAAGCSTYSKLLKSEDHDLQFRTAIDYVDAGKYQKALTLLDKVTLQYMHSPRADSVAFYTALAHYKMGNFDVSSAAFDDFRKRFDRSAFLEEAEYLYAKGFYYQSPEPDRDQTSTMQAILAINEYLSRHPDSHKRGALEKDIAELTLKLHDKAFINARTYYKIGRYKSAIVALQNALDDYPESSHREEILYMMVKSSYEFARNSFEHLKRDRYLDMLDYYLTYIAEYPQGQYAKDLGKMQNNAKHYLARFGDGTATEIIIEE